MKRFLFLFDPHYTTSPPSSRADSYGDEIIAKLVEVGEIAKKGNVDAIGIGGDLFHRKDKTTYTECRTIAKVLRSYPAPVYGICGNHDISGYQLDSFKSKPIGVLEAAGLLQLIDDPVDMGEGIILAGRSYAKDYEVPASYSCGFKKPAGATLIWLSHGMLLPDKPELPYEYTSSADIGGKIKADMLFNGHFHIETWFRQFNDKIIVNAGSVARVAIDNQHVPQVFFAAVDGKARKWGYKAVTLKATKPYADVFIEAPISTKESDEAIRAFAEALAKEGGSLQTDDLKAVVVKATEGRPEEVRDAVCARLGI